MKDLIIKKPARGIYEWRGFTLQKGAIFGTFYDGNEKYAFVYLGQKKREKRPDGTSAGWQMKLYIALIGDSMPISKNAVIRDGGHNTYQIDPMWSSKWVNPNSNGVYRAIFAKNPVVEWYHEDTETAPRNILAYVPKQKNLGFIYAMVRERQ